MKTLPTYNFQPINQRVRELNKIFDYPHYKSIIVLFLIGVGVIMSSCASTSMQAENLRQKGSQTLEKEPDKALEYYLQSLKFEPDNAEAIGYVGYLYSRKGDNEKAEQYLQQSIAKQKNNAWVWNSLGWVYKRTARYAEMQKAFEKAIEFRKENVSPWDYMGLAQAYYYLQAYTLAEQNLNKVLNMPDNEKSHETASSWLNDVNTGLSYAAAARGDYVSAKILFSKNPRIGIQMKEDTTKKQVHIIQIMKNSFAELAGLTVDDIILEANGKPVTEPKILQDIVKASQYGDSLKLLIRRGEEKFPLTIVFDFEYYAANQNEIALWRETEKENTLSAIERYLQEYPEGKFVTLAKQRKEPLLWQQVTQENTLNAYDKYVQEYPIGQFINEAKQRKEPLLWIQILQENVLEWYDKYLQEYPNGQFVAQAKQKKEPILWQQLTQDNTIAAYDQYLQEYPNGQFVAQAKQKKEPATWEQVTRENTLAAYDQYLQEYPNGQFVTQAKQKKEPLTWEQVSQENTPAAFDKYLQEYPTGRFTREAKQRKEARLREQEEQREAERKQREATEEQNRKNAIEASRVKSEVEAINTESRRIGNQVDIRFISFSSGVLTVQIPDESGLMQGIQLLFGGVEDYAAQRERYTVWKNSILNALYDIDGVVKVVEQPMN